MINQTIERLKMIVDITPYRIRQMSEAAFEFKPSPEKWSKKQILGHLIDSAMNNHQRFVRLQYENIPTIVYNQNEWNRINHYQALSMERIIDVWQSLNKHIVHVLEAAEEESLALLCNTGSPEPLTFGFLIDDYVAHMEHHLNQIMDS